MKRTFHIGLSVRGALQWNRRELNKLFRCADGSRMSADDARNALMDELAKGREVIPVGPACGAWDYKKGCQGHDEAAA